MYTSHSTAQGRRPIGMPQPRPFGVEDRPACPSCAVEMHLFRRSPEPEYYAYEVQIFSCMNCDAEITRSVDRKGKPHPQVVLGPIRMFDNDAATIKCTKAALPAPSMVDDKPVGIQEIK
jgi:hypothetical protein